MTERGQREEYTRPRPVSRDQEIAVWSMKGGVRDSAIVGGARPLWKVPVDVISETGKEVFSGASCFGVGFPFIPAGAVKSLAFLKVAQAASKSTCGRGGFPRCAVAGLLGRGSSSLRLVDDSKRAVNVSTLLIFMNGMNKSARTTHVRNYFRSGL